MNNAFKYDHHTVEQNAEKDWERSASIRAEFGTIETYKAFRHAEAQGKVKRISGKVKEGPNV